MYRSKISTDSSAPYNNLISAKNIYGDVPFLSDSIVKKLGNVALKFKVITEKTERELKQYHPSK